MKTIVKCLTSIVSAAIILLLFTGCVKRYNRNYIESYLNDLYIFTDNSNSYEISKQCFKVEGIDGYTDYVWKVSSDINGKNINFYVIDDYCSDAGRIVHDIRDTHYNHCVKYALSDIDLLSFDLGNAYYNNYLERENKSIDKDVIHELNAGTGYRLKSSYNNYDEYIKRFDEITDIYTKISNSDWKDVSLCFDIDYIHEYRDNVDDKPLTEADVFGRVSSFDDIEKLKQEYKDRFIIMNIDYRFYDISDIFSSDEIRDAVSKHYYRIGILDESDSDEYTLIDDLVGNQYGYGISFGTMYELLKKDGQNVAGDALHYTYYKDNGDVYEFSYAFNDSLFDNSKYGYYYKLNNEVVNMNYYFNNHFTCKKVQEITGIPVVTVYYTEEKGFYM